MNYQRYMESNLTGVVIKEKVKCGKSNCKCLKGNLHGDYYYHYYRIYRNGAWKLKKEYVLKNEVELLVQKINTIKNYKKEQRQQEEELKKGLKILRIISENGDFLSQKQLEELNQLTYGIRY